MPVELKGSCHCGAVRFTVLSSSPSPYQLCLCSICRKVGGVGGSINLGGFANTLQVQGKEHVSIYKAVLDRDTPEESIATSERNFCSKCSTMLWLWDETWPDLLHPFASAIDSPELEDPKTMVCIMNDSKPDYVRLPMGKKELYDEYGPDSIEDWHKRNGLWVEFELATPGLHSTNSDLARMMAHLTKPVKYDIKDSNIALLGSDLEKRVREHAGDKEKSWIQAGLNPGLQVWRIEKFKVLAVPAANIGSFYDGDSYIVLHTYQKDPKTSPALAYDLHFWLGQETTQDEAGTAAYKTVELDDYLHGIPVQYREIQGFESARFLSYFPHFVCLHGGVSTGFHHLSSPPPPNIRKLYRISILDHSRLVIREVAPEASSLAQGDVFVLDKGTHLWQFNTKTCVGKERFEARQFVESIAVQRREEHFSVEVTVYDEGGSGAGLFLAEFSIASLSRDDSESPPVVVPPKLFRLSDAADGGVTFEAVHPPLYSTLSSVDAFLLDDTHSAVPTVYVWLGKESSLNERRLAVQYAQKYLYSSQDQSSHGRIPAASNIVKMVEGRESEAFLRIVGK